MKPMNLPVAVSHNADVAISSVASAGASVALTASQVLDPNNLTSFLSLIPAIIGPAIAVYVNRMMHARAARKKAKAEFLEKQARLKDHTPAGEAEATELLMEAAELRAEADALKGREPHDT